MQESHCIPADPYRGESTFGVHWKDDRDKRKYNTKLQIYPSCIRLSQLSNKIKRYTNNYQISSTLMFSLAYSLLHYAGWQTTKFVVIDFAYTGNAVQPIHNRHSHWRVTSHCNQLTPPTAPSTLSWEMAKQKKHLNSTLCCLLDSTLNLHERILLSWRLMMIRTCLHFYKKAEIYLLWGLFTSRCSLENGSFTVLLRWLLLSRNTFLSDCLLPLFAQLWFMSICYNVQFSFSITWVSIMVFFIQTTRWRCLLKNLISAQSCHTCLYLPVTSTSV